MSAVQALRVGPVSLTTNAPVTLVLAASVLAANAVASVVPSLFLPRLSLAPLAQWSSALDPLRLVAYVLAATPFADAVATVTTLLLVGPALEAKLRSRSLAALLLGVIAAAGGLHALIGKGWLSGAAAAVDFCLTVALYSEWRYSAATRGVELPAAKAVAAAAHALHVAGQLLGGADSLHWAPHLVGIAAGLAYCQRQARAAALLRGPAPVRIVLARQGSEATGGEVPPPPRSGGNAASVVSGPAAGLGRAYGDADADAAADEFVRSNAAAAGFGDANGAAPSSGRLLRSRPVHSPGGGGGAGGLQLDSKLGWAPGGGLRRA
jgi:membrane associated rhomboid family serine protease